jgi:hypothetical protein
MSATMIFDPDTKTLQPLHSTYGQNIKQQYLYDTKEYKDHYLYGDITCNYTKTNIIQHLQKGLFDYGLYLKSIDIVHHEHKLLSTNKLQIALISVLDTWFEHDHFTYQVFDHRFDIECVDDKNILNTIVDHVSAQIMRIYVYM